MEQMVIDFLLDLIRTFFDAAFGVLNDLYSVNPCFAILAILLYPGIPIICGIVDYVRSIIIMKRANN